MFRPDPVDGTNRGQGPNVCGLSQSPAAEGTGAFAALWTRNEHAAMRGRLPLMCLRDPAERLATSEFEASDVPPPLSLPTRNAGVNLDNGPFRPDGTSGSFSQEPGRSGRPGIS